MNMKYDWNNLTIDKYLQLMEAFKTTEDEDERILKAAAILNDITYDEILNMPLAKTTELIKTTGFLYTEPDKTKMKKEYQIGDYTLVPNYKYDKMTTAQYIDYQGIAHIANEYLAEFMAIILIPKGHKYNDGYSNDDLIETIKTNMTVEEALGLANFFVNRYTKSIKRMMVYSEARLTALRIMTRNKKDKEMIKVAEKTVNQAQKVLNSLLG